MGQPSDRPSPPGTLLDAVADVGDEVAGFVEMFGKTDKAEKIRKGAGGLRKVAELKRKFPAVLEQVGVTAQNSATARLIQKLRDDGYVTDRPSSAAHGSKK